MKPADYLRLIVLPTLAEFVAKPLEQRRGYLACITTAHLIDYVARFGGPPRSEVRNVVSAASPYEACCLEIVEGICNGTKHAGPGNHAGPDSKTAFQFAPGYEQAAPAFALDTPGAGLDEGRWDGPGLFVAHLIANGAEGLGSYSIEDCLRAVIRAYAEAFPEMFEEVDLRSVAPDRDRITKLQACQ